MILIKLGGSVITDKSQYRTFNRERVARLAEEIKRSGKDVMIVHGAGSFGHVVAKEHSLQKGRIDDTQIPAVAQVQYDVRELGLMVVKELNAAGIPSTSVAPGSCFVMEDGKLIVDNEEVIRGLRSLGVMPVMFGDVVLDRKRGFGICSGDQIMEVLAEMYGPEKVVFVSDIDGLYDRDPKADRHAKLIGEVTADKLATVRQESGVADVTGGVHAKMEAMLRMSSKDRDCVLVNGTADGRLYSLLMGETVTYTIARGGLQ